tara:strand:- start:67468 stop:67620 length:153 start_codon:yes stop_codon:yes gene_type:complete
MPARVGNLPALSVFYRTAVGNIIEFAGFIVAVALPCQVPLYPQKQEAIQI